MVIVVNLRLVRAKTPKYTEEFGGNGLLSEFRWRDVVESAKEGSD
jgi:hypothetical protein